MKFQKKPVRTLKQYGNIWCRRIFHQHHTGSPHEEFWCMGKQRPAPGDPGYLACLHGSQPKEKLKDSLRIMNELTNQYGFQAAVNAMEMACVRGNINICDASVLAACITSYGIYTLPEAGPSLAVYDDSFLKEGGAVS